MITEPIVYSFRRCPYAMRARMAVDASGIQCRIREIVLRDKPAAMLEASPKGTVPVLVLPDGTVIDESLEIMHWALGQNDPEGWLSATQGQEADVNAVVAQNDGLFKQHLDRYKYPNRYADTDREYHRAEGLKILQELDARLEAHPYLFGDAFSIVDAAVAPFVRQFANTDRAWFDGQSFDRLPDWLTGILGSDRFLRVMTKFPVWAPGDDEPIFPLQEDKP